MGIQSENETLQWKKMFYVFFYVLMFHIKKSILRCKMKENYQSRIPFIARAGSYYWAIRREKNDLTVKKKISN